MTNNKNQGAMGAWALGIHGCDFGLEEVTLSGAAADLFLCSRMGGAKSSRQGDE